MDELEELKEGWGFPYGSRKAHYFVEGRSLCRQWAWNGGLEDASESSPDDCKECTKKLAIRLGASKV